jgi:hypothetical protein
VVRRILDLAAQPAHAVDAANGDKIEAILASRCGKDVVSVYQCGAADGQHVGRVTIGTKNATYECIVEAPSRIGSSQPSSTCPCKPARTLSSVFGGNL